MQTMKLTQRAARRYLLRMHGLIGEHRFIGKEGVLGYVRQCGCIQYDPIDVCGRNAELVLQSRIKGFTKEMLYDLLYKDRALIDYFDKNLSIFPVEDWPYFAREREANRQRGRSMEQVNAVAAEVLSMLETRDYACARDLCMQQKADWYWSDASLARVVLETLYFRGDLCIHHKRGTSKHYALSSRMLPNDILCAPDPNVDTDAYRAWHTLRRIRAVGLLWNRASDAFLCVREHKGGGRAKAFADLIDQGQLIAVQVDGISEVLYAPSDAMALLEESMHGGDYAERTELIAPLDCFLWDRKLIHALFDFSYTWEIYTPASKRQYGYYVLPLLHGDALVGRVEAVRDAKERVLRVKGIWWEGKAFKKEANTCLKRFAKFHGLSAVVLEKG